MHRGSSETHVACSAGARSLLPLKKNCTSPVTAQAPEIAFTINDSSAGSLIQQQIASRLLMHWYLSARFRSLNIRVSCGTSDIQFFTYLVCCSDVSGRSVPRSRNGPEARSVRLMLQRSIVRVSLRASWGTKQLGSRSLWGHDWGPVCGGSRCLAARRNHKGQTAFAERQHAHSSNEDKYALVRAQQTLPESAVTRRRYATGVCFVEKVRPKYGEGFPIGPM